MTTEITLRILLSLLNVLIGLGLGFFLRRQLVLRLKKRKLNNGLTQTLGVIVVLLPLLIAVGAAASIATNGLDQLLQLLPQLTGGAIIQESTSPLTTEIILRIFLSVLVVLAGLGLGLFFRLQLVRRLKKTVLDNWLTQTLGVVIVLPPLLVAAVASTGIATNGLNQLLQFWAQLTGGTTQQDIHNTIWKFVWSVVIIVLSIGVARTLSKLTLRGLGEHRLDINTRIVISRVSYILVLLFSVFWIFALWQIEITLPVAVLGTLTVAITFSIQDILKDLVAGLYILIERPFFIGDQIHTDVYTGRVVAVELRATRLRLTSGEDITIPNAMVFSGVVINNSRYAERRATVVITLPLVDFSRSETQSSIMACLKGIEEVLAKPEPGVSVSGITGENVELTVRFWITNGQLATVTDVVYALRMLLPHADLAVTENAGDV
jgi:small conductance mechanosensitive channel